MSTSYTTNYHLGKQTDTSDTFDMSVITDDMDIIDTQMKNNETNILTEQSKTAIINGGIFENLWADNNADFKNSTTDTRANLYLFVKMLNGSTVANTIKQVHITSTGLQVIFFKTGTQTFDKLQFVHNGKSRDIVIGEIPYSDNGVEMCVTFYVEGYIPSEVNGIYLRDIQVYERNTTLQELNGIPTRVANMETTTPYKFTGEYRSIPKSYDHTTSTISNIINLNGKTINLVGDSMTANQITLKNNNPTFVTFADYVKIKYPDCIVNLYGYGGSTIAVNPNSPSVGYSFVERVTGTSSGSVADSEADVWIIWGGYNDVDQNVTTPIGTMNENPVDTGNMYGALRTILDNIDERTNLPRIILVTPHQPYGYIRNQTGTANRCRELRECIYRIGEAYSCQIVDLWKNAGINNHNGRLLLSDSLHLNQNGYLMCYPHILKAVENLFLE